MDYTLQLESIIEQLQSVVSELQLFSAASILELQNNTLVLNDIKTILLAIFFVTLMSFIHSVFRDVFKGI